MVRQCAVLCREFHGSKYLAAYFISEGSLSPETLRDYMAALLPDYMVPSHFIGLDEMPLTVNGKVNRKALPAPDIKGDEARYAAPRNDTEAALCRLWQEELGMERVGITDDFFQLGGNSILAIKLTYKMTRQLQREIPVAALFERKTVKGISEALTGLNGS